MMWCSRCKHLHKASNPRPFPCACHDPISAALSAQIVGFLPSRLVVGSDAGEVSHAA